MEGRSSKASCETASTTTASHGKTLSDQESVHSTAVPDPDVNIHQMYIQLSPSLSKTPVTREDEAETGWNQRGDREETALVKAGTSSSGHLTPAVTVHFASDEEAEQNDEPEQSAAFTTEVDEETLQAAKERQRKGGLFNPENWVAEKPLITMNQVIQEKTSEHYSQGIKHMEKNNYELAITAFNKAINLQPAVTQYYVQRGECFLNLCDLQSAILNYKKACVLEPENVSLYTRLAFIYYFQGQSLFDQKLYPEALEAFSRAAEMRPHVIGYHTRSIACLAALQRHGECLALVNKRLETEHDNADLYVMRARLHELFRNSTLCYYDIKDALGLDPSHPVAKQFMSRLEHKAQELKHQAIQLNLLGRQRDALQKISVAIETNPSIADFHVFRGAIHRRLSDFNSAIDDYLLAMDKTDHNEDSQVYLDAQRQLLLTYNDFAVECFSKGFYEEAIILLNKAIKGEKREKGLYINRGDCFFHQGDLQFALQDYHQALELDPLDQGIRSRISLVHNEFGVQDFQTKNFKEAEARFTLALEQNPKVGHYYISRARARQMQEDITGARQDILIAMHLDPSNEEIIGVMARLFPGKTVKDVIASKAASAARSRLKSLVASAGHNKLEPLDLGSSTEGTSSRADHVSDDDQEVVPPVAGSLWKPGGCVPDLKACMQEHEFHIKVAQHKKVISTKIKKAFHERKSLRYDGPRLRPLPDAKPFTQQGSHIHRETMVVAPGEVNQSAGWRKFTMGVGLMNAPDA